MTDHESDYETNCREIVELVTDYLEDALRPADAAVFEHHLSSCQGCSFYLEQMRTTIKSVGRLSDSDVPVEMRDRLLGAFRDLMQR